MVGDRGDSYGADGGNLSLEVRAALEERKIFASLRGSSLRISPNVYNDDADVAALAEALRDLTV